MELIEIVGVLFVSLVTGYLVYRLVMRNSKRLIFRQPIIATCEEELVYHRGGVKHSFRLHQLEEDGLYGLEIGRWSGPFGQTTGVVLSGGELHRLDQMIRQFVDQPVSTS